MAEKIITIGSGTMGQIIAGEEAVSLRQTEVFDGIVSTAEVVFMATRQEDGLRWLKQHRQLLAGKTIVSLMAFVSFETLETAVDSDEVSFVRIMTDTSFKSIAWSDDGSLTDEGKVKIDELLKEKGETKYLGERHDEGILLETIKACQLGWLAQAMSELMENLGGEKVLVKVLEQRQNGRSFADIAQAVATSKGATEAGMMASEGLFLQAVQVQQKAGLKKAIEKRQRFKEEVEYY